MWLSIISHPTPNLSYFEVKSEFKKSCMPLFLLHRLVWAEHFRISYFFASTKWRAMIENNRLHFDLKLIDIFFELCLFGWNCVSLTDYAHTNHNQFECIFNTSFSNRELYKCCTINYVWDRNHKLCSIENPKHVSAPTHTHTHI